MSRKDPPERATPAPEPPPAAPEPYEPPELVEYGSVTKLTQGTLSISNDGPGGGRRMTMMNCL